MATNKYWERGTPLQFTVPAAITSSSPVMMRGITAPASYQGRPMGLAMVANADYSSTSGLCSFDLEGAFMLSVLIGSLCR